MPLRGATTRCAADIGRSIRILGFFIVIATAAVAVAADPGIPHLHEFSADDAIQAAVVLVCFLVGLIPLACCSSCSAPSTPTATPARPSSSPSSSACWSCDRARRRPRRDGRAGRAVPRGGVALGQSLASLLQVILASWLLHRRLGDLGMRRTLLALGRFAIAADPCRRRRLAHVPAAGGRGRVDGLRTSSPALPERC